MMYYTHLLFGFIFGLLAKPFPTNQYVAFFLILLGSVFPDIDQKNSFIGKKFSALNDVVTTISKHRGIFHTIWLILFLYVLFYFLLNSYLIYIWYFALGFLSHLISDSLTYAGIRFFHPLLKFKIRGFIETNSFGEFLFDLLLIIIIIFLVY